MTRAVLFACLLVASLAAAADPAGVLLPAPVTSGTVSVEQALATRRSLRGMAAGTLTLAQVGQLCWAAQGVTDDKGHRTAPSALATYPLDLYLIADRVDGLAPGVYHYVPDGHRLEGHDVVTPADASPAAALVAAAIGQDWITTAPAILVIAGTAARMGERFVARRHDFMCVEAGLAAQGFFLEATAIGLGSTFVGGFDPAAARTFLALDSEQEVLAVLPVGARP